MYSSLERIEYVILVLWIGGIWTVGYIVAPVLFTTLTDRSIAAFIAGRLFSIMAIIGMGCGTILLAMMVMQIRAGFLRQWQFWVLIVMLGFTAMGYFFFSPAIEAMRQSGEAARASLAFKRLHGMASILYLCTSLGGLALVAIGLPRRGS